VTVDPRPAPPAPPPGWAELLAVFGRIGVLSFGGPAAQIALMHRELVEARGWLSDREFLGALSFCMLLPGPEAMQLATFAGWKLRRTAGGLLAGLLFVAPGAAVVLGLSILYAHLGGVPLVQALFLGVQAAVVAIVAQALLRIARRALVRRTDWLLATLAFLAIFALAVPFPVIVAAAAVAGAALAPAGRPAPAQATAAEPGARSATVRAVLVWGTLWLVPLGALAAAGGILGELALFFSKLAVVTFGGAYAVLAYMTQEVVQGFGWLTTSEMVDGLGLAETTPGPLILVTLFVGFLAAFREGGLALGLAGAAVTLWMTFVPCFLWVLAGAPWIGWIAARPRLSAALAGVTAAVVGVILNLALWFAAHVFFAEVGELSAGPVAILAPRWSSADPAALAVGAVAAWLVFRRDAGLLVVLAVSAALGAAVSALP
jgi:chromate transporter